MFHSLLNSAWAGGNLAEEQLGKMVKHPNQSQPNPTQVHEHMNHPVVTFADPDFIRFCIVTIWIRYTRSGRGGCDIDYFRWACEAILASEEGCWALVTFRI